MSPTSLLVGDPPPRNYLIDNLTSVVYPWPVNHETEDSVKSLGRRISSSGVSSKIGLMRQFAHPGVTVLNLHGHFLDRDQAQYAAFIGFFNNCDDRTFTYIDAAGDSYEVILLQFDARRLRGANRQDGSYFEYTLEMHVLSVNQGPLEGFVS